MPHQMVNTSKKESTFDPSYVQLLRYTEVKETHLTGSSATLTFGHRTPTGDESAGVGGGPAQ